VADVSLIPAKRAPGGIARAALPFFVAAALLGATSAALAAPGGNDGSVYIRDPASGDEPNVHNEPQLCTFYLDFEVGQYKSGTWWIEPQGGGGGGSIVLPEDGNPGTYATEGYDSYLSPEGAPANYYSLPDGHYKLSWDEAGMPGSEKHKTFWVDCTAASPSPSVTPTPPSPTPPSPTPPSPTPPSPTPPSPTPPSPTPPSPTPPSPTPPSPTPPSPTPPSPTPPSPTPPSPTPPPEVTPTPTPMESIGGETDTPDPTESVGGVTSSPGNEATPPTTGTEADRSDNGTTPIFAILIGFAFAALAAFAAAKQRRAITR